jgi:hypothetical protein
MTSADFLRLYAVRAPHLMWFLGAGSSATSGIATADDMIWDFKRALYCAEQRVSIRTCQDLRDPLVQQRLQRYFDGSGKYPAPGFDSEYADFFTAAYPAEADRRRYIDRIVSQATPSYGNIALAVLMALGKATIVWTTNFDRNVEDSAAKVFGTTAKLTVATLDGGRLAEESIREQRWPLLAKLHGDFQSRRLKNTAEELLSQDERLRGALVDACRRFGLVVVGYSGRDHSVMNALEEGLNGGEGFPHGLFWINRPGSTPYRRVLEFIAKAKAAGIQAHQIEANNFDELMGDLLLMIKELPPDLASHLDSVAPRMTEAPMPLINGGWPVVRLNALPITSYPTVCRRVACDVGGMKEVRKIAQESGRNMIVARRKVGVIAFGSDADIRAAFAPHNITEWDLHSIEPERLAFESMEMSLLYDALITAIGRERALLGYRRKNLHALAINPKDVDNVNYKPLRDALGNLSGTIPKVGIWWSEAINIRLELRLDRLWILVEPSAWVDSLPDRHVRDEVKEFYRNRSAVRYNKKWNSLVEAWSNVLTRGEPSAKVSALGISDGVDAAFEISRVTAFSRRAKPS